MCAISQYANMIVYYLVEVGKMLFSAVFTLHSLALVYSHCTHVVAPLHSFTLHSHLARVLKHSAHALAPCTRSLIYTLHSTQFTRCCPLHTLHFALAHTHFALARTRTGQKSAVPSIKGFWTLFGIGQPMLQKLATTVMVQAVSQNMCESNFSDFTYIVNGKRNKRNFDTPTKLVYVYCNLSLLN